MWTGLGLDLVSQSLLKGPAGLNARAQRATFAGTAKVTVKAVLQAAAQAASTNNAGLVSGASLNAIAQAATFAGSCLAVVKGTLAASSQAATFDGDGVGGEPITIAQAFTCAASDGLAVADALIPATFRISIGAATTTITLGDTLWAEGISPPVVTLTGTLGFAGNVCPEIYVECNSVAGGTARGQAFFRVSYDGGATWALAGSGGQVTAATVALDGAASDVTLNFPTGTYGTTQKWTNTCETCAGTGFSCTNATDATQPRFAVAAGGEPARLTTTLASGTGRNCQMIGTDAAVINCFVNSQAFTLIARIKNDAADPTATPRYFFGIATSSLNSNRTVKFGQVNTGSGRYIYARVNNDTTPTNATQSADGGISASPENVTFTYDGSATATIEQNETTTAVTGSITGGTLTADRYGLFGNIDVTPDAFARGSIYELVGFNSVLSGADRTAWRAVLTAEG